jgi:hypothetical protein
MVLSKKLSNKTEAWWGGGGGCRVWCGMAGGGPVPPPPRSPLNNFVAPALIAKRMCDGQG